MEIKKKSGQKETRAKGKQNKKKKGRENPIL